MKIIITIIALLALQSCSTNISVNQGDKLKNHVVKKEYKYESISDNLFTLKYRSFFGIEHDVAYDYLLFGAAKLALENNKTYFEALPVSYKGQTYYIAGKDNLSVIKSAKIRINTSPLRDDSDIIFNAYSVCSAILDKYYKQDPRKEEFECYKTNSKKAAQRNVDRINNYYKIFTKDLKNKKSYMVTH